MIHIALLLALYTGSLDATVRSISSAPRFTSQDPVTRQLLKLEDDWAVAVVRRDSATFHRMLAPGFIYSEDDRTMTRDEVLHEIVSGADTVTSAHNEQMTVHRFGTTAVVTGWLILQGHGAGGPFNRRYRFTDTWMRLGGRWQIIAAHDYLMPAKGS